MTAVFTPTESLEMVGRFSYSEDDYDVRAASTYSFANGNHVASPVDPAANFDPDGPGITGVSGDEVTASTTNSTPPFGVLTTAGAGPIRLSPDPRKSGIQDYDGSTLDIIRGTLIADWDGDWFDIKSWTSFTRAKSRQEQDTDRVSGDIVPCGTTCLPGGSGIPSTVAGLIGPTELIEAGPLGVIFGQPNSTGSGNLRIASETEIFSQELRVSNFDDDNVFRWGVGGLFWTEDYQQSSASNAALLLNGCSFGAEVAMAPPVCTIAPGQISAFANERLIFNGAPGVRLDDTLTGGTGLFELATDTYAAAPAFRKTDHYSIYVQGEWDVFENLTVGFEGRYNWEDYEVLLNDANTQQGFLADSPFPFDGFPFFFFTQQAIGGTTQTGTVIPGLSIGPEAQAAETVFINQDTTTDNWFSWRAYAEYDATDWFSACGCDDILFYASAAQGVKPGGFATLNFNRLQVFDSQLRFEPEELRVYEGGVKSTWFGGQVIANLSGGYQKYNNKVNTQQEVLPDAAGAANLTTVFRNAANGRVYFLELDGAYAPEQEILGGNVVFTAAYTYLNTKYTDFVIATQSSGDIARGGNCTRNVVITSSGPDAQCLVDLTGNQFERQPKHAIVGGVSFTRPLFGEVDAFAAVDVQYQGDRFLAQWNRWVLESYVNVDARVGLQADGWNVIFYGENLTEDTTVRSAQENFDLFSFGTAIHTFPTQPLQFGVRMGVNL